MRVENKIKMTEHTLQFASPDPEKRYSDITPTKLLEQATLAGRKVLEHSSDVELLAPEEVRDAYHSYTDALANKAVREGVFEPITTQPLNFKVEPPLEPDGKTERKDWRFLPQQYLESIVKGVYPISFSEKKPQHHDLLHAAEISILQKYCPKVSQLMIDAAAKALESKDEQVQVRVTENIDYFTDSFILDEYTVGNFELQATSLYYFLNPELGYKQCTVLAKGLALEACSGLARFMSERANRQLSN